MENNNFNSTGKCRFKISRDKWYMSHEEYLEFCNRVKIVYRAIMRGKGNLMQREIWKNKDARKLFFAVLEGGKKVGRICLDSKRSRIYKKIGIIMYYKFRGAIPEEVRIVRIIRLDKIYKNKNKNKNKNINKNKKNYI